MSKKAPKDKTEQKYDVKDVVLAKLRGYPPWPAVVVDPEDVPKNVKKERPKASKTNYYCVRFFPAGDHAWFVAKDLSKLHKHEIESYIAEPHKKNGDLLTGYRIALNPSDWQAQLEVARKEQEEEDEAAEVDELDDADAGGENADGTKAPAAKKRKRDSEPKAKPKKKPAKEKDDDAEEKPKKKAPAKKVAPGTGKKKGKKSFGAETIESEDDGGSGDADDAPPTKRAKRDKDEDEEDSALANDPEALKIKDWRHKLQRAFLRDGALPSAEDMPTHDQIFKTVEEYDGLTIEYLSFSKIGKVMRKIASLPATLPRDDEFKFRDRASVLVKKWQAIVDTGNNRGAAAAPVSTAAAKDGEGMDIEHANGTAVEGGPAPLETSTAAKADANGDVEMKE